MNHKLVIISLGDCPAAVCECGRWGHTFTTVRGDTEDSKKERINQEYAEHVKEHHEEMECCPG